MLLYWVGAWILSREQLNTVLAAVGDGRIINTYGCSWILTYLLCYHTNLFLIIQLIAK